MKLSTRIKVKVERAYFRTPENCALAYGGRFRPTGWIRIVASDPPIGVYPIIGHSFYTEQCTQLGYKDWDSEVENLDGWDDQLEMWGPVSEGFDNFGIAEHVRWREVDFYPDKIVAPSLWLVYEALNHVRFIGWDPEI